nr:putative ribonuclease H-like domain-containing protein [Tanacetum cinerariifolium]
MSKEKRFEDVPIVWEIPKVFPEDLPGLSRMGKIMNSDEALFVGNKIHKAFLLPEFRDFDEAPTTDAATGSASEGTATKKGRTIALTTKDMRKRKNDIKARTTLLLALLDEHQLPFINKNMLFHYKAGLSHVEASKDLDSLLESQRSDKNKEGLGYSAVPPPAQVYSLPKKDLSWTGIPEFADDTVTDYSRPTPTIESTSDDVQNKNSSETEASSRVKKGRTCSTNTHKSNSPRPVVHKTHRPQMRPIRPNVNAAKPKRTLFYKPTHSYRPFQRVSTVRSQFRAPCVPTVNRKFPTVNRKFPTGSTKFSTADVGNKGTAVKASAIENLKELRVKIIRCDNGGEFKIKEMNDFCSRKGIKREFSNARTLQQNGIAERRNRTLIEAART